MRFGCSAEHAALGGKTARGQPRQAPARGHCGRRAPKNRKEGGGQSDAQLGSSGSSKGRVNGSAPGARASRALSRPGEQSGSEQEEEEEAEGAQIRNREVEIERERFNIRSLKSPTMDKQTPLALWTSSTRAHIHVQAA
ncbi:unnamed protein product [Prorocentrum cordatum]|uniref:Uncharacterized protein n=1 Tax=Prorocentrum cordatum TaxID=2364126 RepID=A0ABN9XSV5_9DINO|nr:unnamed protein product [Polarella glacialis]